MHVSQPYKTHLPSMISLEGLAITFTALSEETRAKVISELLEAQRDTSVEYHRNDPVSDDAKLLLQEVFAINFGIVAAMEADNEFKELFEKGNLSSDGS